MFCEKFVFSFHNKDIKNMIVKNAINFPEKHNIITGFSNVLLHRKFCLNIFGRVKVYLKWNKLMYFNKLRYCMIVLRATNS